MVKAINGRTHESDELTFTANFRLPDDRKSSFIFTIDTSGGNSCNYPTVTRSGTLIATHSYPIKMPQEEYQITGFTVNGGCTLTLSSRVLGSDPFDTEFFT